MTGSDFRDGKPIAKAGLATLTIFAAIAILWGATAPVRGSGVATGKIAGVHGTSSIEHPDGGVVAKVFVRNGDAVEKGDPLALIEAPQLAAETKAVRHELMDLRLTKARLTAEMAGHDDFVIPEEVRETRDPDTKDVIAVHRQQMKTRQETLEMRLATLDDRKVATAARRNSLSSRMTALEQQIEILDERLKAHETLLAKGYMTKSAIARQASEISAVRAAYGEAAADMSGADAELAAMAGQRAEIVQGFSEAVADEMKSVSIEVAAAEERARGLEERLARLLLCAATDGIVQGIRPSLENSVAGAGEPIMYIVPRNDHLEIDVPVAPGMLGEVATGDNVDIRLIAVEGVTVPRVTGLITFISPDLEQSQAAAEMPHYLMRVRIEANIIAEYRLRLGTPIQVILPSRDKTMAQYVLRPVVERFWR